MIKAVVFDMGGTIEDLTHDDACRKLEIVLVRDICRRNGIELEEDIEQVEQKIRAGWKRYNVFRNATDREVKPGEIWADYILADYDIDREKLYPIGEELSHMWEVTNHYRKMRPDVPEMLEQLRAMGLKLGIISNTPSEYQVFDILDTYGIRDYFDDVTLSSVTGYHKPGADMFKISARQLHLKPEECVYVGDTIYRDVLGSQRGGFATCIMIPSDLTANTDRLAPEGLQPEFRIQNMIEIVDIVKQLIQEGR